MNQVNCPVCGNKCIKAGKTKAEALRQTDFNFNK